MSRLRHQLGESLRAFRTVFSNPNLRRLELAAVGSTIGGWSYGVAISVYAFEQGGAGAVGLVLLLRWLPAAFLGPFTAVLADRFPRERVMVGSDVMRAVTLTLAALAIFADSPAPVVYALASVATIAATAFHPAQSALTPSLARTPDELTAANVTTSTIDSVGVFVGPALGGLLFAVTNAGVVFAATAATLVWSALLVSRIRPDLQVEAAGAGEPSGIVQESLAGFRTILSEPSVRLLVGLFAAQTFVDGALTVLVVVAALELLDLGSSGVGILNSAAGVGGLLGALGATALVGRQRLAASFGFGIVLWGVPIALLAVWPNTAAALVLLAIVGGGNTIVDVAGYTLLQRAVAERVLARVFGVLGSLTLLTAALGAILAPAAVSAFGTRAALIGTGVLLPMLAAVTWRGLARIDAAAEAPGPELSLLQGVSIFSPLPPLALEGLARRLSPAHFAPGTEVFRQGDRGDRFYVVSSGEVEVEIDGKASSTLGPGASFGEIALLRDVPRTATIRAKADVETWALERDDFLSIVTGHAGSSAAADAVVRGRLGVLHAGATSA